MPDSLPFPDPPHAHIPGKTPRHPEGRFDALCATALPDQTGRAVFASDAWRAGLQFFRSGYFWEAHEVWEAVWMALPDELDERRLVQGMIQLANAALKEKMERPRAVLRLCDIAEQALKALPEALWRIAGLSEDEIRDHLLEMRKHAHQAK